MRGHGQARVFKRRLILATGRVKKNPGVVDITALKNPVTGAPLEPPFEYGKTIAFDPYSHEFFYITPKGETSRVTPTFTKFHRRATEISKTHVDEAKKYAEAGNLEMATRKLWDAQMAFRRDYPGSGFWKDPIHTELGQAYNEAKNMLMTAGGKRGGEYEHYTQRGLSRVLASASAVKRATERERI